MKLRTKLFATCSGLALVAALGITQHRVEASDHDDGEIDLKSRALNLTDHYAFRNPTDSTKLALLMYVNPRSLPGRQYYLSENARYEFHVTKAASVTAASNTAEDFIFRIEAGAPTAAGVQPLTLTVLSGGTTVVGTATGTSTGFVESQTNTNLTINTVNAGGAFTGVKLFVGQRTDGFHFDVNRFFQVRDYLARRFFGGAGGIGDPTSPLAANCEGDAYLQGTALGTGVSETIGQPTDFDNVNLWNPPSCAPDFTKNLNITSIALEIPIAALGGGSTPVLDTWSTISIKEVN